MIDKNLISLVSRYDEEEEPLRKEEEYLKAVKKFGGDATTAKESIVEKERLRQVKVLNLVEQMSQVISTEENVLPSERKTAVSFLSGYIRKGFNRYITEKKDDFPESITMSVNGWIGTTTDGGNFDQLSVEYDNYLSECCDKEVMKANTNAPKIWKYGAIVLGIFSVLMIILAHPIVIISAVGAGVSVLMIFKSKKDIAANITAIRQRYTAMSEQGKNTISACINQWNTTKNIVNQFNSEPIRDIIA
jgi:hypothetical protein